jgi:hypothetical protein
VVRVPGYRSRVPGSISGATTVVAVVGLDQGPLSLVSAIGELLGRKNSGFVIEIREYSHRDVTLTAWNHLSAKLGTNFADKRRLFGRYSSFANSGHGVFF